MHLSFILTALLPIFATASPVAQVARRQSNSTACGKNDYTTKQITAAVSAGCQYWQDKKTVGSDKYPHKYNDYEGFDFGGVDGPYLEFPILEKGVYSKGKFCSFVMK
jgi:hypothetical protein